MRLNIIDPLGVDAMVFNDASTSTGLASDQLKFMGCLLLSFPLGLAQGTLCPAGTLRHVWSVVFGLAVSILCFEEDTIHPVLTALTSYILIRMAPDKPMLVLIYTFAHMSAAHLYSWWFEYGEWNVDYTMAQMVLTVKIQTLAFSVMDGHKKDAKFHPKGDFEADRITPDMMPSPLEFFSYILFYPTFIAGPCFTYKRYRDWADGRVEVPAGRVAAAGWKFLAALFILFLNKVVLPKLPSERIVNEDPVEGLVGLPLYQRLLYIWFSIALVRTKYFFVWYLSHSCCILSGLAYNGKGDASQSSVYNSMFETSIDSNGNKWDGCSNGNWFGVELATNFKGVTDNWNMGVNYWLKNDVYLRLCQRLGDRSQVPVLLTQVTSAFWHGFYPGYYFFFVSATYFTIVARNARSKLRPIALRTIGQGPYDMITRACTGLTANYIGTPFCFMDWQATLRVWQHVYFIPHICGALVYLVTLALPSPSKRKAD